MLKSRGKNFFLAQKQYPRGLRASVMIVDNQPRIAAMFSKAELEKKQFYISK